MAGVVDQDREWITPVVVYANNADGWINHPTLLSGAVAPEHLDAAVGLDDAAVVADDGLAEADTDARGYQTGAGFADGLHDLVERAPFPFGRLLVVAVINHRA